MVGRPCAPLPRLPPAARRTAPSPWLVGRIFDATGSYALAFSIAGEAAGVAALFVCGSRMLRPEGG